MNRRAQFATVQEPAQQPAHPISFLQARCRKGERTVTAESRAARRSFVFLAF